MANPITNKVNIQLYGDGALQERVLAAIAKELNVDVVVTQEKDYETKRGQSGHFIAASVKL